MKLVYLIMAHKNPPQVARLVKAIHCEQATVFVHIDAKCALSGFVEELHRLGKPRVQFIRSRVEVRYSGGFSQALAVLRALPEVFTACGTFDYLILLSGQDYPIKDNQCIVDHFRKADEREFLCHAPMTGGNAWRLRRVVKYHFNDLIPRPEPLARLMCKVVNRILPTRKFPAGYTPYWGCTYWRMTHACARYVMDFAEGNRSFVNFFRYSLCADECLIPTIIMHSPFARKVISDDLTYADWPSGQFHPKTLGAEDFEKLTRTEKLFARKFDAVSDSKVLDLIDGHLRR